MITIKDFLNTPNGTIQQNFESHASLSGGHCKTEVGAERIGISH